MQNSLDDAIRAALDGQDSGKGVQDFEASSSALRKSEEVLREIREAGLDRVSTAILSIGGADGTELEDLLLQTQAMHGVLFEFDDDLSERARERAQALVTKNKIMRVFTGDVIQKLAPALELVTGWVDSGTVRALVLSMHAVLHELPARGSGTIDIEGLLGKFLWRKVPVLAIAREPCMPPDLPGTVYLSANCQPDNLAALAAKIKKAHPSLFREEAPTAFATHVRMEARLAVETIWKLFYLDSFQYELQETITSFTKDELLSAFRNVFSTAQVRSSLLQTDSFNRLWTELGLHLRGDNKELKPEVHVRIVAQWVPPGPTTGPVRPVRMPSKVLPIRRPPLRRDGQTEAPQSAPAQWAAVAALLAILLPDEVVFRDACATVGLPPELFWAASSSSDRWYSAIATAGRSGIVRWFIESASSFLPPELRCLLELTESGPLLNAPRWDREELYNHRLRQGKIGGNFIGDDPDIVGVNALRRIWGKSEPELIALRRYLDETEEMTNFPLGEGQHVLNSRREDCKFDLGLAAEHLLTWCESSGGEQLLAWSLENIACLSPARFTLITAIIHWWDDGRKRYVEAGRAIRDQALDLLSRQSIDIALSRLSALDQLLHDAGGAWWASSEAAPSVHFATRAGRLGSVAELMEVLGDQRPSSFIDQLTRLHHHRDAIVPLARALRRLRIAGLEGNPTDPELKAALECSLPGATTLDLNALIAEPRRRALWLDLLSPPLSDSQIGALIEIHAKTRHAWERDRARRWLCTTLEPIKVWQRLAASQRRRWVEELTEFELLLVESLGDNPPPADTTEMNDWTQLQQRLSLVRKASGCERKGKHA